MSEKRELIGQEAEDAMRRMSRKSFIWSGIALVGGYSAARWLITSGGENLSPAFARALQLNDQLWGTIYSPNRLAPTLPKSALTKEPRVNGIPEQDEHEMIAPDDFMLAITGIPGMKEPLNLDMDVLRAFPKTTVLTEFNCIEGWTQVVEWSGVRLKDVVEKSYKGELPMWAGMESDDELYYVSIDTPSALHPQTLLCYEMNGEPLSNEHGGPLRLIIPVKYGVKNIKWLASIDFSDKEPKDYWAERNYDKFGGL